jgi:hypothetical protein
MNSCPPSCLLFFLNVSNNSLSFLPSNLFIGIFAGVSDFTFTLDLSLNAFTAMSIGNFFLSNSTPRGDCVFCGFQPVIDLSFNELGPVIPSVMLGATDLDPLSVTMMGCGITQVQSGAFSGVMMKELDLRSEHLPFTHASQSGRALERM